MRRAHSLRNHSAKGSSSSLVEDLGLVKEGESIEDILRDQLLASERENDKLKAQILSLQDQLTQRPPMEQVQELEREYRNLELLLTGTQRENERCMAELDRAKNREKMLERELTKLAGENWQNTLNIPPSTSNSGRSGFLRPGDASSFFFPQAESTGLSGGGSDESNSSLFLKSAIEDINSDSPATPRQNTPAANAQTLNSALSHIAEVRALILGMEERMQSRENRLTEELARAEGEARRFEALRKEVDRIA